MPALLAEERPRLREEVELELAQAVVEDRAQHEREDSDGHERGEDADSRERLLDAAAPAEVVRRRRHVVAIACVDDAHAALRCFSNRRTISCASTFVTSEMTIRIAAR